MSNVHLSHPKFQQNDMYINTIDLQVLITINGKESKFLRALTSYPYVHIIKEENIEDRLGSIGCDSSLGRVGWRRYMVCGQNKIWKNLWVWYHTWATLHLHNCSMCVSLLWLPYQIHRLFSPNRSYAAGIVFLTSISGFVEMIAIFLSSWLGFYGCKCGWRCFNNAGESC